LFLLFANRFCILFLSVAGTLSFAGTYGSTYRSHRLCGYLCIRTVLPFTSVLGERESRHSGERERKCGNPCCVYVFIHMVDDVATG